MTGEGTPKTRANPREPRVSVVVPTFDMARYVPGTLDSVLAQSFEDWECLVVDDGSADGTLELLEEYRSRDPRLRILRQPNRGVSRARNAGVERSRGELVAFLDADDLWLPAKLEKQVAALDEAPDAGMCGVYRELVDDRLETVQGWEEQVAEEISCAVRPEVVRGFPGEVDADHVLGGLLPPGNTSGLLIRRSCFDEAGGFDPDFRFNEDRDLWFRIARRHPIVVVPEVLLRHRVHPWGKYDFYLRGEAQLRFLAKARALGLTPSQRVIERDARYFAYEALLIGALQRRRLGGLVRAAGHLLGRYPHRLPARIGALHRAYLWAVREAA